jgi:hypothetical protein
MSRSKAAVHASTCVLRTAGFTLGAALRVHQETCVLRTAVFTLGAALRVHQETCVLRTAGSCHQVPPSGTKT